jgi:hypothetical protein
MNDQTTNKPIDRIKVGAVTASIWRNESEAGRWYSVVIERTYKDEATGEYKVSKSYRHGDLPFLGKAVSYAFDRVRELKAADRAEARDAA